MTEINKNKEEKNNVAKESDEHLWNRSVFLPATDIFEKKDSIFVLSDIPGVEEKNVNISLENDILTVTAYRSDNHKDSNFFHQTYQAGVYKRSFTVGSDIDREKIRAELSNGVLKLEFPKMESMKPKKIIVNAE